MKHIAILLAALASGACATLDMQHMTPAVPFPVNAGARSPLSVAIVVPAASRSYSLVQTIPGGCFGVSYTPGPVGEVFAQSVVQALQPYFGRAVLVDSPSSSADLIVEATLESVGTKTACLASPDFYSEARGAFRLLGADGVERWRAATTSGRAQEPMSMSMSMTTIENSYRNLAPKALAQLAASWAAELAAAPQVRSGEPRDGGAEDRSARGPAPTPAASGAKPWWQQ